MSVEHLTEQTFDSAVASGVCVVDFWAPWCGPCRMLSPTIAEIAEEYKDKVKVGKVNVDEEGELASMFRVSSIPMLVVMKNGKVVNSSVGVRPKEQILKML
jgi:thioredoxin 1